MRRPGARPAPRAFLHPLNPRPPTTTTHPVRAQAPNVETCSIPSTEQVTAAVPAAATTEVVPPIAPATTPDEISADAAPAAAATGPAGQADAVPAAVGLQAANAAHKAAAAVAASAAADAAAAAGRAGVTLCRQHSRVAVWAADGSIRTELRLREYEARCSAEHHAEIAKIAAALCRLDPEHAEAFKAVLPHCLAAKSPLDLLLREKATEVWAELDPLWRETSETELEQAYSAITEHLAAPRALPKRPRPMIGCLTLPVRQYTAAEMAASFAWLANKAKIKHSQADATWDGTVINASLDTGFAECPVHWCAHGEGTPKPCAPLGAHPSDLLPRCCRSHSSSGLHGARRVHLQRVRLQDARRPHCVVLRHLRRRHLLLLHGVRRKPVRPRSSCSRTP